MVLAAQRLIIYGHDSTLGNFIRYQKHKGFLYTVLAAQELIIYGPATQGLINIYISSAAPLTVRD